MKRVAWIVGGILLFAVVVVVLLIGFGGKSAAGDCRVAAGAKQYRVDISGNKASATNINGHLCDTITFTNSDDTVREIAFGPHEHHVAYDGVTGRILKKGESFTITLNKTGTYHWHDHIHDEITGNFTVSR